MTVPFGWDEAQRECERLAADNVRLRVENGRLSREVSVLTARVEAAERDHERSEP